MDADDLLRTHALNDLRRLIPPAHYMMREHSPAADRELTEPLLKAPVFCELTAREHAAADALAALTTYKILSRAIWSRAFPVQDADAPMDSPGMTADEQRDIDAMLEVFRRSALVYARVLGDAYLVESFQQPPRRPNLPKTAGEAAPPAFAAVNEAPPAPAGGLPFKNWLHLEPDETTFVFDQLPRLIANALWVIGGTEAEQFQRGCESEKLIKALAIELKDEAEAGRLTLMNPLTGGRYTVPPTGAALDEALVQAFSLVPFLAERGVGISQTALQESIRYVCMHESLKPKTDFRGGRIADVKTYALEDAAQMATLHAGCSVTVANFLQAASNGEITLHAICHRDTVLQPCNAADAPMPVPLHALPTLPLTACQSLEVLGHASWRTHDHLEIDKREGFSKGDFIRYTRWQLPKFEPDLVTVLADCRVKGYAIRALADAYCEPPEKVPAVGASIPPLEDWKMRVQAEAAAHWLQLRKLHCNPTKHGILPHLAKWCRENNILTSSRINPSEGYLRTHVLNTWEPPR